MKSFLFFVVVFGGSALAAHFRLLPLAAGLFGLGFGFVFAIERVYRAVTGEPLMTGDRFFEVLNRIL